MFCSLYCINKFTFDVAFMLFQIFHILKILNGRKRIFSSGPYLNVDVTFSKMPQITENIPRC